LDVGVEAGVGGEESDDGEMGVGACPVQREALIGITEEGKFGICLQERVCQLGGVWWEEDRTLKRDSTTFAAKDVREVLE